MFSRHLKRGCPTSAQHLCWFCPLGSIPRCCWNPQCLVIIMAMFVEPSMCKFRSYPHHESYLLKLALYLPHLHGQPYMDTIPHKKMLARNLYHPSRVHLPLCLMANSPSFVIVKSSFMMFESLQQALGIHGGSCDKKDMTWPLRSLESCEKDNTWPFKSSWQLVVTFHGCPADPAWAPISGISLAGQWDNFFTSLV